MNQTFIDGTAPIPATGPWTGEVESAKVGKYLVVRADFRSDVFFCCCNGDWICARDLALQEAPRLIARIYPMETNNG